MGSTVDVSLLNVLWVEGTNDSPSGLCTIGRPGGGPWYLNERLRGGSWQVFMQDQSLDSGT